MFFSRINAAVKFSAEQDKNDVDEPENEIDKKEKKEEMKSSILKAAQAQLAEKKHIQSLDPTGRRTPYRQYIIACRHAEYIVNLDSFNNIIFLCIVTAGILVGAQTYPTLEGDPIIGLLDTIILVVFTIEVVLKIMSEGMDPVRYFIGSEWHWNCFDFCIVMFSILPFGGGQVAFLRLIRLMRLAKVFRKVPQLRMIMTGLIGGLKSIVYIVILLLLVFYLYAIAGIFFFRGNDPWHFRSIAISLTSLFRLATLSNWADMFYINYYGCAGYQAGLYVLSKDEVESDKLGSPMFCSTNPQPALSMVYFVSFIFICSFSMLSLFVGAITVSMSESMQTMKLEKQKMKKLKKLKNAEKKLDTAKHADRRQRRSWALVEMAFLNGKVEVVNEDNSENHVVIQAYKWLSKRCERLADSAIFQNFITLVIILAGVQVGMSTDPDVSRELHVELFYLDAIIRLIFTFEVVVKIVSEELTPWMYFENNWNTFDFIVVIGSYVSGGGSIIVMLRLLRLLRVLKLMRMLPQLQVIVSALMSGFSSITFISIILILFFYFFGIIAMILFQQNDPWHFGTLHMTMIVLFQCSTLDNWTDILYTNLYGCDVFGYDSFPHLCTNPASNFMMTSLFFIIFILMGALVLLTLFIGVVATSMEEATDEQKAAESVEERVAKIAADNDLDDKRILLYREVFDALDLNGGNSIDSNELRLGMKAAGRNDITDDQFKKLWRAVDNDNSGGIDFSEFLSFMMSLRKTRVDSLNQRYGNLKNHEEPIDPVSQHQVIESNTKMVAEQLFNIASNIGPLDSSVKIKELMKKTSMGRPNSAPRVLNRLYSHEHSIYKSQPSGDFDFAGEEKSESPSGKRIQGGSGKADNFSSFSEKSEHGGVPRNGITSKATGSAAKYIQIEGNDSEAPDPGGAEMVPIATKPSSKPGSNRSLFSRDAKVMPVGPIAESENKGTSTNSGGNTGAFHRTPQIHAELSSTRDNDHQVPPSPGTKRTGNKTPTSVLQQQQQSGLPPVSSSKWTGGGDNDADADDRAAHASALLSTSKLKQQASPLALGEAPFGTNTQSKSPSRQRPGTKTKKVVSKVCFV